MYAKFGVILLISLGLMWVLSMSMIRSIDHFYFNLSNFWMALLMVLAMGIVMVVGMWSMFKNRKANIVMLVGFAVLFAGVFALGRTEAFVGNEQFLKSMIRITPARSWSARNQPSLTRKSSNCAIRSCSPSRRKFPRCSRFWTGTHPTDSPGGTRQTAIELAVWAMAHPDHKS